MHITDAARRTLRTVFQLVVTLSILLAAIADDLTAAFPEYAAVIGAGAAFAAGLTRIMATPAVEEFLERWFPWLAAEDPPPGASVWTSKKR